MTDLIHLLSEWMPTQRWYAGAKDGTPRLRHLGSYVLADPEDDPSVRLITVPIILDESGDEPVVYQVPIVLRPVDAAVEALGYIGSLQQGGRSSAVVDGPHDRAFARALLDLIERERTAPGASDSEGDGERTAAYGLPMPGIRTGAFVTSRVLSGEQSNTSIICETRGDDGEPAAPLILKVFRTLHDGDNPDVTLQTALAAAGSVGVPPVLGHVSGEWPDPRSEGGRAAGHLVFAQEFLPGVEDAWRVALRAAETGEDFADAARSLGEATAATHAILRHVMPTAEPGPVEIERAAAEMRARFVTAAREVPEIAGEADAAERVYARAASASWPTLQRIHGDLHLGQVLAVPDRGWVFLDFEGEPLRPMAERNAPDVPHRDVAGMLRSFDYVAGALSMQAGRDVAREWADAARAAFLEGYRAGRDADAEKRGAGHGRAVSADDDTAILAAYELDKAVYEAIYEARHRPDWLPIPVAAIRRILGDARESSLGVN